MPDLPDIADPAEVARRLPQFEIHTLLGRGGMGVVYQARQVQLDRIVALKILPPADALTPDFVERFRREARSLAKLSHPNIVSVYEFGEAGGLYYFVMEFVDGVNLREMLRTQRMTPPEALAVVPKICDALQYAHEEGVVHRDIKPENILIDKRGRVKIADFGLAKLLRRELTDHTLTHSGMALGTPRYMAPEQLDKPETVDHRADIYSLGVVFYEMLTGEVPMGRFAPPSEKVQIDVRLDEIVLHALERDADRRYQHASEVKTAVESVSAPAAPGGSAREGSTATAPGPRRPFPWLAVAASVTIVAGIWFAAQVVRDRRDPNALSSVPPRDLDPGTAEVLRAVTPKIVGAAADAMPGYAIPGPTLLSGTTALRVVIDSALAGDLKISRLHFAKQDATSVSGNPGYARLRSLEMWIPPHAGLFSQTTIGNAVGQDGSITIVPSRPLPDGVYCLHTAEFREGKPAPSFAAPFVIGGLSKFLFGRTSAVIDGNNVRLSLELINEGSGEFNEGQVVITLQKNNPGEARSSFTNRWEARLPAIPAGGKATYSQTFDASTWKAGNYHFYGHAGASGASGDSDKFEDFTTNIFTLPANPQEPDK